MLLLHFVSMLVDRYVQQKHDTVKVEIEYLVVKNIWYPA